MQSSLSELGDLDAESSWTAARVEEVMFQDLASQGDGSEESWFERIMARTIVWCSVANANASCFLVLITRRGTPATTE
jgi:hypothetical protein